MRDGFCQAIYRLLSPNNGQRVGGPEDLRQNMAEFKTINVGRLAGDTGEINKYASQLVTVARLAY